MTELRIGQGETQTLELTILENGSALDLTGWEVQFSVRKRSAHQDNNILISKSSTVSAEIDIVSPTTGRADVFIDPEDTEPPNLNPGTFLYDVWVIDPSLNQFQAIPPALFRISDRVNVV